MIFFHISFHKNHQKRFTSPQKIVNSKDIFEHVGTSQRDESWNISAIPHVNKGILPRGHNFHYNLGRLSEYQLTTQQQKCCMWFEYFLGQGVGWWNNVIWPIAYRFSCHLVVFPSFPMSLKEDVTKHSNMWEGTGFRGECDNQISCGWTCFYSTNYFKIETCKLLHSDRSNLLSGNYYRY